jgi:hypothetical protein
VKEICHKECLSISGGDCVSAFSFGGAVAGTAIGGAVGFFGGFGISVIPGMMGGGSIGTTIGTIGGAYFCFN